MYPHARLSDCFVSHLFQVNAAHLPPVKYQILNCQGKDILVRIPGLALFQAR